MTVAARVGSEVREALFAGLFDDAALFPPGNVPMPAAVVAHRARTRTRDAVLTGPFVCPDTRVAELGSVLAGAGADGAQGSDAFPISLVVPGGSGALAAALRAATSLPDVVVRAIELPAAPTPAGVDEALAAVRAAAIPEDVPVHLELAAAPERDAALHRLAGSGVRAKIRTGGTVAAAFPDEHGLATALTGCVQRGLAFKLTAGLHHAVRYTDPVTRFEHHGFLNVLLAVAAALAGGDIAGVGAVLADRDGAALAREARGLTPASARSVRAAFVSFGTCSISEPVADLITLGLLDRQVAG
ncbi:hypothetical protein GCM10009609_07520 [Pseudonocardia aurantiaca]|uniref:Uncharacterized protein n=1 Tax=Pseudonocardia aurantiaca TaxID=75290 RepID=A0ABW4FL30_9PSEU